MFYTEVWFMLRSAFRYIFRFIPLLITVIITLPPLFSNADARLLLDIEEQKTRIAALETAYENGEIAPVDENLFFDGDLEAELNSGIKFNELRYIATHNSYQTEGTEEICTIYSSLSELTFGLLGSEAGFKRETVTEQLNNGVYSLELDIETFDRNGEISFTCMHSPKTDMATSCYDFALTLKEIAMWSDNNPDHLPVTIIVEPKTLVFALKDMKSFKLEYAQAFDALLREQLGDKLFTPDDMLRDYPTFAALRADDGWCEVKDMLGKVLILLHDCSVTQKYIKSDPSLRSLAMFPMLRKNDVERDCASFILVNDAKQAHSLSGELIEDGKFIVRTRADSYGAINKENSALAIESSAQIVSTDYPVINGNTNAEYLAYFGDYKSIKPNR